MIRSEGLGLLVRGQFFETTMKPNLWPLLWYDRPSTQTWQDLHDGHFHTGSPLQLLSCVQEFGKKEHASIMRSIADHSSYWPAFRLTTPLAHSGHVRLRQYSNLHVHRLKLNIPLYLFTWNSCIYEAIEWWGGEGVGIGHPIESTHAGTHGHHHHHHHRILVIQGDQGKGKRWSEMMDKIPNFYIFVTHRCSQERGDGQNTKFLCFCNTQERGNGQNTKFPISIWCTEERGNGQSTKCFQFLCFCNTQMHRGDGNTLNLVSVQC